MILPPELKNEWLKRRGDAHQPLGLLPSQVKLLPPEWEWEEGRDYFVVELIPTHQPKPWYFKIGRLNMVSGEPVGLIFRVPGFELIVSIYAA